MNQCHVNAIPEAEALNAPFQYQLSNSQTFLAGLLLIALILSMPHTTIHQAYTCRHIQHIGQPQQLIKKNIQDLSNARIKGKGIRTYLRQTLDTLATQKDIRWWVVVVRLRECGVSSGTQSDAVSSTYIIKRRARRSRRSHGFQRLRQPEPELVSSRVLSDMSRKECTEHSMRPDSSTGSATKEQ